MIRPATVSDIPRLLEMAASFADKSGVDDSVGYVADDMEMAFRALLAGGHPIFIGEAGAIGATSLPHPFNNAHIAAQELFWWSEGREGLKLLDALESYCDEHCHSLRMNSLEAIRPEATGRIYLRRGYVPLEHSYLKVF